MIRSSFNNAIKLSLGAVLLASGPALSDETYGDNVEYLSSASEGWYISGAIGMYRTPEQSARIKPAALLTDTTFPADNGPRFLGAIGYENGSGSRAEIEFGRGDYQIPSSVVVSGAGSFDTKGKVEVRTFMANYLFSKDLGSGLSAYAGAGAGLARFDVNFMRGPSDPNYIIARGNNLTFAYQGILGVNFAVSDTVTSFAQYNYLATQKRDFKVYNTLVGTRNAEYTHGAHSVVVGLRFALD